VIDAGEGAASDIADLDLDGALALVRRSDNLSVAEQSNRAAHAGAAMVAVYNNQPGQNAETGGFGARLRVPTVRLSGREGVALIDLLGDGPLEVDVSGEPASPYAYDLVYVEHGTVPDSLTYVADPADLVDVHRSFHSLGLAQISYTEDSVAFQPWQSSAWGEVRPLHGAPRTRTDYHVWHPETEWLYHVATPERPDGSGPLDPMGRLDLVTQRQTYEEGERVSLSWLEQPLRVGLNSGFPVTRVGDRLIVAGGPNAPATSQGVGLVDAQSNFGAVASGAGEEGFMTRFRVTQGDTVLTDTPHSPGAPEGFVSLPDAELDIYRMSFEVRNNAKWAALSTRLKTDWLFRSERPESTDARTAELMTVNYDMDVDLQNRVPSPRERRGPWSIGLTVGHQQGVDHAVADVTLELSFDDGETWRKVPVRKIDRGEFTATLGGTPRHAKFVSLRLQARDTVGNTIEQEIIRAALLDHPRGHPKRQR
jgi:hypothetical protein